MSFDASGAVAYVESRATEFLAVDAGFMAVMELQDRSKPFRSPVPLDERSGMRGLGGRRGRVECNGAAIMIVGAIAQSSRHAVQPFIQ